MANNLMEQKRNPDQVQPPVDWLYGLLIRIAGLLLRPVFRLQIKKDPAVSRVKGPVIVVGNHPSYLDPLIMAVAVAPRRVHFLASREFFRNKILCALLMRLGAIPKTQFRTDRQSIKNILNILRQNGAIAIYPEGQRSIDGRSQVIDDSLSKLIYKMKPAVILVKEQGAYLSWPRWSKNGMRPGPIQVSVRVLLSQEQIARMQADAIHECVATNLKYNDYEGQEKLNGTYFSFGSAYGLHQVCHQCPACHRELAIRSRGRRWFCKFCGYCGWMDLKGQIHPDHSVQTHTDPVAESFSTVAAWHDWQIQQLSTAIQDPSFERNYQAVFETIGDVKTKKKKKGLLKISQSRLLFYSDQNQKTAATPVLDIPLENRSGISAAFGKYIEIAYDDRDYRLTLKPGQAVIVIADMIQVLETAHAHKAKNL